jgi:hypothetical protein
MTTRRLPPGKYRVRFLHVSDVPPETIGWHFEVCGGPHDGRRLHLLTGYQSPPGSPLFRLLCALARRTLAVGQAVDTTTFKGQVYSLRLLAPRRRTRQQTSAHRDGQRDVPTGTPDGQT